MNASGGLDRLAEMAGIEPQYWDIWGNLHRASDEAKRTLLAALGIPAGDDAAVEASIREMEQAPWRRPLPPVAVIREHAPIEVTLHWPAAGAEMEISCEVIAEPGDRHPFSFRPSAAPLIDSREVEGRLLECRRLAVPIALPTGYHTLRIAEEGHAMRLIIVPAVCYLPEPLAAGARQWGLSCHLYTLRSEHDWGIGDFANLAELVEGCARLKGSTVGINPLHALFPTRPEEASPYSPSSRLFLNPLYTDVEAIEEFAHCPEAQRLARALAGDIAAARAAPLIDYSRVAALKRALFEPLFTCFQRGSSAPGAGQRRAAFARFAKEGGERLRRFAVHETLCEHFSGVSWPQWPAPYRRPESPEVAEFAEAHADRVMFHTYLQWQAEAQLAAVQQRAIAAGLCIGLYRDLAVGVDPSGADAWSEQEVIVGEASVGAPPDPFNMLGQDWGTPPLSPLALREKGYEPFIAMLRANMRDAGALRIDHAMGLLHLYWIPRGAPAASGAYLRYPFDDLLGILALESQRNRCLVIGEDLGTVPEGFRERMATANVLSYRVLYFEKEGDRFKRPDEYPRLALACVTTHDLAPLAGFWEASDVDLKKRLGLYPSAEVEGSERAGRVHDRWLLLKALAEQNLLPEGIDPARAAGEPLSTPLIAAIHRYLGQSPAMLVMVQLDEVSGEIEQLNLPGTVDERPNWRRRLALTVDQIPSAPVMRAIAEALAERAVVADRSAAASG